LTHLTGDVVAPQRVGVAFGGGLRGRERQPLDRLDVVAGNPLATVVHDAEAGLSADVAAIGGAAEPRRRLWIVGRAGRSGSDAHGHFVLRREIAVASFVYWLLDGIVPRRGDARTGDGERQRAAGDTQQTTHGVSLYRRAAPWLIVAAVALLWPARTIGPLDGAPLDGRLEAVAIGLVFPLLCWLAPQFLLSRLGRTLALALLAVKLAGALVLVQHGWCARFITPAPLNQDGNQTQLTWDVRADWRSPVPQCSAILARPYRDLQSFPVWFLNLAGPSGRPPGALVALTLDGFVTTSAAGTLSIAGPEGEPLRATVDGTTIPDASRIPLDSGTHEIHLRTMLQGERWQLIPLWNGSHLFSSALTTIAPPSGIDRALSRVFTIATAALALLLLATWVVAAVAFLEPGRLAALWVVTASAATFAAGIVGVHSAGRLSVLVLLAAFLVPVPERLRNVRGAVLLVGVPWLALFAGSLLVDVGRITLFTPGDDFTHFQRFAYRIYMQGFWLEGGQWAFWYQPLYRWVIGATHIVFGDSSIGEWYLDAACLLISASFAFVVCDKVASFRWGVAAAAMLLATVAIGPSWWIVGRDLSEITAAGFAYTAALLLVSERRAELWCAVAAGILAVLCFYTRLNHLLWLCAMIALLLPLDVSAGALWRPREWWPRVPLASAAIILAVLGVGLTLFAWRTYYYTGFFSVFYGTQRQLVATIQPTDTFALAVRHLIESVLVLATVQDPPRFDPRAILVVGGIAVAVLALLRVPWCRDVPAGPALFCVSGLAGALVARGTAYVGRFSIHLMPVAVALAACCAANVVDRLSSRTPRHA